MLDVCDWQLRCKGVRRIVCAGTVEEKERKERKVLQREENLL